MLTGEVPFNGLNDRRVMVRVANADESCQWHPPRPDIDLDDNLWELIKSCWTKNPAQRPSITSVRDHLQALYPDYETQLQEPGAPMAAGILSEASESFVEVEKAVVPKSLLVVSEEVLGIYLAHS